MNILFLHFSIMWDIANTSRFMEKVNIYKIFLHHQLDFIPTWQSNSNPGWVTWKCMSNIFNTGVTIIIDSTVCPQFGHKYSIHWKETANGEEEKYLYLLSPKIQRACVFTLRFQHHHKMFSRIIKVLILAFYEKTIS